MKRGSMVALLFVGLKKWGRAKNIKEIYNASMNINSSFLYVVHCARQLPHFEHLCHVVKVTAYPSVFIL